MRSPTVSAKPPRRDKAPQGLCPRRNISVARFGPHRVTGDLRAGAGYAFFSAVKIQVALLVGLFACRVAFGADPVNPEDAAKVAVQFVSEYANAETPQKWIAKTPMATDAFKKAIRRIFAAGPDADPILHAQDIPNKPYRAKKTAGSGDTAHVTLISPERPDLKVTLVREGASWKVQAVDEASPKK